MKYIEWLRQQRDEPGADGWGEREVAKRAVFRKHRELTATGATRQRSRSPLAALPSPVPCAFDSDDLSSSTSTSRQTHHSQRSDENAGRVHVQAACSSPIAAETDPSSSALRQSALKHVPLDSRDAAQSEAISMEERASKMFIVGSAAPIRSGTTRVASKATRKLVMEAHSVVYGWKQSHVKELSKCFGNFDRVVALGWLVADALTSTLVEHRDAYLIGLHCRNEIDDPKYGLKADIRALKQSSSRACAKLPSDSTERTELQGKLLHDIADLNGRAVDLSDYLTMPEPAAAPSGAPELPANKHRKRKRDRPAAPPKPKSRLSTEAREHVSVARSALAKAKRKHARASREYERLQAIWARKRCPSCAKNFSKWTDYMIRWPQKIGLSRLNAVAAAYEVQLAEAELRFRLSSLVAAFEEEEVAFLQASASVPRACSQKKFGKRAARKMQNCGVRWRPMRLL